MDSSRGIPVEYKLDAFNMPRTGTTLCHPKISYVDLNVIPLSTLASISPLGHFNGDQCTPLHQTDKNHGDSKTQSLTRPTTHAAFSTSQFRLNTHNPSRVLQHQKKAQIFHAANKNLFIKTPFDLRHLTSSFILL